MTPTAFNATRVLLIGKRTSWGSSLLATLESSGCTVLFAYSLTDVRDSIEGQVFDLILAGRSGQIPKAVLVGDDRVFLETHDAKVLVRPAHQLAGLIEIRGLGIRRCDFIDRAVVGRDADLQAEIIGVNTS